MKAAIEGLYTVFAGYTRPPTFVGCVCCWEGVELPDGQGRKVRSPGGPAPLRALNAKELADLASQVPHLGGDTNLLKHYLPRVLEIATVGGGFDWPDLEVIVGHFAYRHVDDPEIVPWSAWPERERLAVQRFLRALWRDSLTAEAETLAVDVALCAAGLVDDDIDWYLDAWLRFEHPNAAGHLERFLMDNVQYLPRNRLANAYWNTDTPPAAENRSRIAAWSKAQSTLMAVANAADHARTPAEREALEECYLRWLG